MTLDLLLKDGLIVAADRVVPGSVGIRDGRIAVVAAPGEAFDAARVVDCRDKWIMPGVIDPHVHFGFGDPARDFATESRSAALGGVTFVLSFFRTQDFLQGFEAELARSSAQSVIDYGYHFGLTSHLQVGQLAESYERFGVSSHKIYMMYKGQAGLAKGFTDIDDGLLFAALREAARLPGAVMGVHCENVEVIPQLRDGLRRAGRDDLAAWDEQSPDFLEAENVHRVCYFAAKTGCAVNIVHLSAREGLDEARRHRARTNVPIHVETCPHYLHLTTGTPAGTLAKVNPPVRGAADVEAMWEGVIDGSVTTIGSDHVPRKRATKEKDIWSATNGFPGVATILPIMVHEGFHKRGVPIEKLSALMSANAARIYSVPGKGAVAPGYDADIAVVDPDLERTVDPDALGSFADYSPYEGERLKGWPVMTISRGRILVEDGKLTDVATEGSGRYVRRNRRTS